MRFLRKNTAVIVTVGPFYDKTDGVTIETALTITNERITLTADTDDGSAPTNILDNIAGATSGTSNDLNYITGNDAGMMQLELAAADTNRLGRMFLSITDAANHVPVFHEFMVVNSALYDAFFATSGGAIPNVVAGASGGAVINGVNTGTVQLGTLTMTQLATTTFSINGTSNIAQTGDSFARLGAPTGASTAADIAAVKVDTAAILVDTGTTLDGNITAIKTKTDFLPSATAGAAGGLTIAGTNVTTTFGGFTNATIAAATWSEVLDGTRTGYQLIKGFAAAMLGKASGLNVNAPKYRNIADTKNVIDAVTDADGNRTTVTLDLS